MSLQHKELFQMISYMLFITVKSRLLSYTAGELIGYAITRTLVSRENTLE